MTAKYPWYDLYIAAVLETDWTKIQGLIQTAEFELGERQRDVSQHGTDEEIECLAKCLDALRVLRSDAALWLGGNDHGRTSAARRDTYP